MNDVQHRAAPARTDPSILAGYQVLAEQMAAGRPKAGWKLGAVSKAHQGRYGLNAPVTGVVWADGVRRSGEVVELAGLKLPGMEPELAVRVAGPAGAEACRIGAVFVAAEIVEMGDRETDLTALVGGNFSHRGVVMPYSEARSPRHGDLMTVERNGQVIWSVPTPAEAELVERLAHAATGAAALGEGLREGDLVMTGVVTPMPVRFGAGDRVAIRLGEDIVVEFRAEETP